MFGKKKVESDDPKPSKRAIVLIDVFEDAAPRNSETQHAATGDNSKGLYRLAIYPSPNDKLIDIAAHELGHVLANVFQTPENAADPRTHGGQLAQMRLQMGLIGPGDVSGMVGSEQQAWDLGRKMVPSINPETEKRSMESYRSAMDETQPDSFKLYQQ